MTAPDIDETIQRLGACAIETIHGIEVADPYRWLEEYDSPETQSWLTNQNYITRSVLDAIPHRKSIAERLKKILAIGTKSPPCRRGGTYFFFKRDSDQNQAAIYVRSSIDGPDEVLVDPNESDPVQSVQILAISVDGSVLLYAMRLGGEDEVTPFILNVASRERIPARLPRAVYYSATFTADNGGIYYSISTDSGPRVYFLSLSEGQSGDEEIFGAAYGPAQKIDVCLSRDGRYVMFTVLHGSAGRKAEIYVHDLAKSGVAKTIIADIDASFFGIIEEDHLYLLTNANAPNGRIVVVDLLSPAQEYWREVIPESNLVITEFSLVGSRICVSYLENVSSRIKVFNSSGKYINDIPLPTIGFANGMWGEWNSDEAFYIFSSFAQPPTVYRYLISSGAQEIWSRDDVPLASDSIETRQMWFKSKDGTSVPMFLVHKKGIKLDCSNPAMLTGYGGFGFSASPAYTPRAAFWVECGGLYAAPSLRGGGEFGSKWHEAGVLANKQNAFDDFIAAAEWLISSKLTSTEKLSVYGSSNGGLVAGAAMTQRPDLFRAIVCAYPLLDMVRYHIGLRARLWIAEYGSSDDPEEFEHLYRYSPYHRIEPGVSYPATLFITSDADTRVAPFHALKMAALVQSATCSDRPVLLSYRTMAGHAGGQSVDRQVDDLTDEISFVLWQLQQTS